MKRTSIILICALFSVMAFAQERTLGLVEYDGTTTDGVYLFSPKQYTSTYLIDACGGKVNEWPSLFRPGNIEYFMPDGNIMIAKLFSGVTNPAAGGQGGLFLMYDWNSNLLWEYYVAKDSVEMAHHEFQVLPNGNILVLAWDWKSVDESIANGRDSALLPSGSLWPEKIVELRPILPDSAEVVWEWYLWDHLIQDHDSSKANFGVIAEHPELFDLNFAPDPSADWIHANALDYDPVTDQIIMGSREWAEFYVIDHSTTTEEAATHSGGRWGKGGDILFRFGNPEAYQQGDSSDRILYDAHGAGWVDWGIEDEWDITVFNDGLNRPGGINYSDILQFRPMRDVDSNYVITDGRFQASTEIIYQADPVEDFYARFLSGVSKIEDDKYLISDGPGGTFFEVDRSGHISWRYNVPVDGTGPLTQGHEFDLGQPGSAISSFIFRATKYQADDPRLAAYDLTSDGVIELEPLESLCAIDTTTGIDTDLFVSNIDIYPNPVKRGAELKLRNGSAYNLRSVTLLSATSQEVSAVFETERAYINTLELPSSITPGIYILRFEFDPEVESRMVYQKLMVY